MDVRLNIPDRIRPNSIFITRHFLLLEPPLRQLNLVRKQITPRKLMPQPKLRLQRPQPLHGSHVHPISILNFYDPVVIRVACEARKAISGHFVLEIDVGDGCADVVRVEAFCGGDVFEADDGAGCYPDGVGVGPVEIVGAFGGDVEDPPVVVTVAMWVERDLLLYERISRYELGVRASRRTLASSGIVVRVGV